jgi:A/G-specific adenine glycosylase
MEKPEVSDLLDWYDAHARRLPWRAPPGLSAADPYHVWLSEIMLQQTTVAAVIPYFERFLTRWPTVQDLARAPLDDVLAEWAGLGYYARARNLYKCSRKVSEDLGGVFPDTEDALRDLPGIGAYTAAAIAAIAFGRRAVVVDGNVERVMARLFAVKDPLPGAKAELRELADVLTPDERPGDYAQAVMDLGATICTPKSPKCLACPWASPCRARAEGIAPELPRRTPKAAKPIRQGVVYWLEASGPGGTSVLLRRRSERGLLGGMAEVPSEGWSDDNHAVAVDGTTISEAADWSHQGEPVRHTFTHFHLELTVKTARLDEPMPVEGGYWCPLDDLEAEALPSVMRKVVRRARS